MLAGLRGAPAGHHASSAGRRPRPSTPATARAASSSSCGAWPASAITAPSSAPTSASATVRGRRARRDRPVPAPRVDQAGAALDQRFGDPLELAPDRMVLTAELEPQRHRDAGDVAPAEDGVTARQRDQRGDRIGLLARRAADLAPPRLVDPLDHRQGEVLLVLELVVERAARVAGVARHLLEDEVAVAVAREAPRGRLEQGAARACAALGLGRRA